MKQQTPEKRQGDDGQWYTKEQFDQYFQKQADKKWKTSERLSGQKVCREIQNKDTKYLKDEWELTADDARANENYALKLAAYNGHVEALKVLIEYYEIPLTQEIHDELISKAFKEGHLEVIDYLSTIVIEPAPKRPRV